MRYQPPHIKPKYEINGTHKAFFTNDGERWMHYKKITLEAVDPKTDIWVSDMDGHLVIKGEGLIETRLLQGSYNVQFGTPKSPMHLFELHKEKDTEHVVQERDLSRPDFSE